MLTWRECQQQHGEALPVSNVACASATASDTDRSDGVACISARAVFRTASVSVTAVPRHARAAAARQKTGKGGRAAGHTVECAMCKGRYGEERVHTLTGPEQLSDF